MKRAENLSRLRMRVFLVPIALAILAGCGTDAEDLPTTERNKLIIQNAWDIVVNQGDLEAAKEIFAEDYVYHGAGGLEMKGLEAGVIDPVEMMRAAFPDLHVTVRDMIAEGDMVVHRWSGAGMQKGEYRGFSPSDKRVEMTGIIFSRIENGRIVEDWSNGDDLGIMQQIGAIPVMERMDFTWRADAERTGTPVSSGQLRALFDREVRDVWGRADVGALDEILSPDFVNHDPAYPGIVDFESFKGWVSDWLDRAPDLRLTVEDTVAEGDLLAVRWSVKWTDEKGISGFLPTRKVITVTGMDILRGADGKIVERWCGMDVLGVLQKVGIIPRQWKKEEKKNPIEDMQNFIPTGDE